MAARRALLGAADRVEWRSGADMKAIFLMLAVAFGAAACGARTQPESVAEAAPGGASVNVHNAYTLAVDVIASGPGGTVQLGRVSPGMDGSFALAASAIRNGVVEIVVRVAGGGPSVSSGAMDLQPGQVVDFDVGTQFVNSSAAVH